METGITPIEEKIMAFFAEETGVDKGDLACSIADGDVTLKTTRWLKNEGWAQIMDYVDVFDGEWVKDGKNSHWIFPIRGSRTASRPRRRMT